MRRLVVVPALTVLAFLAPSVSAAPPLPQVTDPANDANYLNGQRNATLSFVPNDHVTPILSQTYADVRSILWQPVTVKKKVGKKTKTIVTGFTVTTTLQGAPTVPSPRTVVYRMLGTTPQCGYIGVEWFSSKVSDPSVPQAALYDNCQGNDKPARHTAIPAPLISGNTIKWTVPLALIPKDAKVNAGSTFQGLYFATIEVNDYKGQRIPDGVPGQGGTTSLVFGTLDESEPGAATFTLK